MIKVITADNSAVVRSVEKQLFTSENGFDFLLSVGDAKSLVEQTQKTHPDLIVCSSDIPDLKNALRKISLEGKTQIIILTENPSGKSSFYGFSEIQKPDFISMSPKKILEFVELIKKLCAIPCKPKTKEVHQNTKLCDITTLFEKKAFEVLLIGVSTGGPKTLQSLLENFDKNFPLPILVTQHIDSSFDKNMVSWLNKTIKIPAVLAEDNIPIEKGHVYFAPAECHLTLKKTGNNVFIKLDKSAPINFLRPAVDKMFESAANVYGPGCLAVLLTGMGSDGTVGCRKIKKVDGYTIGESEETCVVYGMSKAAMEADVIDEMLPLYEIGKRINTLIQRRFK